MSDTPRTDAAEKEFRVYDGYHNLHGMAEFSRKLERENADLSAQLAAKDILIELRNVVLDEREKIIEKLQSDISAKDKEIEKYKSILRRSEPTWLYIRMSLGELHIEKVLTSQELETDLPFRMTIPYMYAALKDYESKVTK